MVRASKSDKQSAAPVVPENVVVPPVAEKKAEKNTQAVKKDVAPVVEAAPVAVAPAVDAEPSVESSVTTKMTEFSAKLQQLFSIFSTLKSDYKTLEKAVNREMKVAQKNSSKKSKRSGNRQPSGFVKPTRISDELAKFLGKTVGTEMARTDVSKEINSYIRANSLQDKTNGRKIIPDAKLSALLKIKSEDELTYFNLQRFMKHHFVKAEVAAVATA
jgi:chromatin remodeling complex protein RSC6